MAKAFQKIYTKITAITKATCSLKAEGVGNDELATVNGKLAQVVKIMGDDGKVADFAAICHVRSFLSPEKPPDKTNQVFFKPIKKYPILHVLRARQGVF